jgi:hypothetical protein
MDHQGLIERGPNASRHGDHFTRGCSYSIIRLINGGGSTRVDPTWNAFLNGC